MVEELTSRGHKITILTGLPNYPNGELFKDFSENCMHYSCYKGSSIIRVPIVLRGKSNVRLILNYISFVFSASFIGLWKIRNCKFDVILVFGPSPITSCIPAILFRTIFRIPLVFWVLDLWPETLKSLNVVRSKFLLYLITKLVIFIYNRCDNILVQSKSFIRQITKHCINRNKIFYFPNWAEKIFYTQDFVSAKEIQKKQKVFTIMFAGNIGESQDFSNILAAAEILRPHKNIRWYILGDGRLYNWVVSEVKKRDLQGCFFLLGNYPLERMPSFFKHADVLLVSLKNETAFSMTIPGKIQSYLAAGKPILAMLNGEGARIIKKSFSGLVSPAGNAKALAGSALKMSKMDPKLLKVMGNNGTNFSYLNFNSHTLINNLENILKSVKFKK